MSTVKVDTIQTTGGVSEIAIDKLKGVSAASSISVVAEGGTTTTNLQQGISKTWINLGTDGGSAVNRDSFNVSSIDDDGTGLFTVHHNNNMGGIYYAKTTAPFGTVSTGNMVQVIQYQDHSASQAELNAIDEGNSAYDMTSLGFTAHGDLA
tara:strand:+ start:57 stop:509 length:453 start_codon:yes stop_codon:yes gene_type:complete